MNGTPTTLMPVIHAQGRPSLSSISSFLQFILPLRKGDVPFHYHVPRHWMLNPSLNLPNAFPSTLILSITPTKGVYAGLSASSFGQGCSVAFIHRPFNLDRYRVPHQGAVVLASHKGFDEALTVGYNTALAARLGLQVKDSICLQGYKGDPERRIGILGRVNAGVGELIEKIMHEFGDAEGVFGCESAAVGERVKAVAIMNAFHPDEVERVQSEMTRAGFIAGPEECANVLYLTGARREQGLQAALAKGMKVVCVGHKTCELWGIKYLAEVVGEEFPELQVLVVDEEEEVPIRPKTAAS